MPTKLSKRRGIEPAAPMRVLHRLERSDGHWAEIRERLVTELQALEVLVFVDGSLLVSQLFHGGRVAECPDAIATRVKQFIDGGWTQSPIPQGPNT
jgi:hypothetical protein